ncbi:sulfurtransferase Alvin_2599-like [Rhinoraja longicauda]
MNPVIWWIRSSFQSVQDMGSDSLVQQLAQKSGHILLLDVRSAAEYEVSHLEGAVRIDPDTSDVETVVKDLGLTASEPARDVVCYCTVGYRSSRLAQRLDQALSAGAKGSPSPRVYNLEGGLVKWANEGKPIVDSGGKPTPLVHPYSAIWAPLLQRECRAKI